MHPEAQTRPAGGPAPDTGGPASSGRRPGALYRQVALHLASHPDTLLKVGEVTTAIGARSSGAVFEALKRMAAAGHALHHSGPHRFQVAQAGIDAAGSLPPARPAPAAAGRARRGGSR